MTNSVQDVVHERRIREVLHFTTNHGLIGILASGALLSRDQLNADDYLDSVKLLNCDVRQDLAWTGYVNMSISSVNKNFLVSSTGWHPPRDGLWWAVLSFSPTILEHDGVVFTTTNNIYESVVQRAEGVEGLEALYAPSVRWGRYGSVVTRSSSMPSHQPTHFQAEVLYPGGVPLKYLEAIYVPEADHVDDVRGMLTSIEGAPTVRVEYRPEVFQ